LRKSGRPSCEKTGEQKNSAAAANYMIIGLDRMQHQTPQNDGPLITKARKHEGTRICFVQNIS